MDIIKQYLNTIAAHVEWLLAISKILRPNIRFPDLFLSTGKMLHLKMIQPATLMTI